MDTLLYKDVYVYVGLLTNSLRIVGIYPGVIFADFLYFITVITL